MLPAAFSGKIPYPIDSKDKYMPDTIYDKGEIVFTKGDPSEFAYVIQSGEIEILDDYPERPFQLAVLKDGDIFGEMGLVDERPRSLTARAISETRVAKISRDEFADMIMQRPEEAFSYLRMFFERLRAMNMRAHMDQLPKREAGQQRDLEITVFPNTAPAGGIIPSDGLRITEFPFRVGRQPIGHEKALNINDLTLPDKSPFNISRNHFSIEKKEDRVFIHDRGSYLGTIVNGKVIGGNHQSAWEQLEIGENEVIAGSAHSPFGFRIGVTEKN